MMMNGSPSAQAPSTIAHTISRQRFAEVEGKIFPACDPPPCKAEADPAIRIPGTMPAKEQLRDRDAADHAENHETDAGWNDRPDDAGRRR